jgi:DNA-binding response OmpR family regulator
MSNILIIDDNPEILETNMSHLTDEGFIVTPADTGMKALAHLNENQYDCIVMDIMLPDTDGFALCSAARKVTAAPIIFLSCLDSPDDKVKGLMIGGDDYITKPYSLKELAARIHAHLRRKRSEMRHISFGKCRIDKLKKMIHTPEKEVFLSQKEFELFLLLFENPGRMFSKIELLEALWPDGTDIGTVAVHILKLRRKLEFAKEHIGTIDNDYKHGYYLLRPDKEEAD